MVAMVANEKVGVAHSRVHLPSGVRTDMGNERCGSIVGVTKALVGISSENVFDSGSLLARISVCGGRVVPFDTSW